MPTTILDTAGIRKTSEVVEMEGIKRAFTAAANADLILVILDGSDRYWPEACVKIDKVIDRKISQFSKGEKIVGGKVISDPPRLYVLNKADRGTVRMDYRIERKDQSNETDDMLVISAKKQNDINLLSSELAKRLAPLNHAEGSVIITRQRHRQSMQAAHDALCRALTHDFQEAPELAAEDFRLAAGALGRITGEIDVEELLESIFSAFCIGK